MNGCKRLILARYVRIMLFHGHVPSFPKRSKLPRRLVLFNLIDLIKGLNSNAPKYQEEPNILVYKANDDCFTNDSVTRISGHEINCSFRYQII